MPRDQKQYLLGFGLMIVIVQKRLLYWNNTKTIYLVTSAYLARILFKLKINFKTWRQKVKEQIFSCHNFKRNEKKPRDSSDKIKHIHNFQVWFEPQFYIQLVYKAPLYLIFRKNISFFLLSFNQFFSADATIFLKMF